MVIDQNVYTKDQRYIVMKGQVVTDTILELLRGYARTMGIIEPIRVLGPSAGYGSELEPMPTPSQRPVDGAQSRGVA